MRVENLTFGECLKTFERELLLESEEIKSMIVTVLPSVKNIRDWHTELFNEENASIREFLNTKRGITDDFIRKFLLGFDSRSGSIVLPIFDSLGADVGGAKLLKYDLSTGKKTVKTIGSAHLFNVHLLSQEYDKFGSVIICEGELDAIVLCQIGFLAVSGTAGASTWKKEWTPFFRDKHVVICYDSDNAGRKGAAKVVNELLPVAASVKNIDLFGDQATPQIKDITDFFVKMGKTAEDFQRLIEEAKHCQSDAATANEAVQNSDAASEIQRLRSDLQQLLEGSTAEVMRNEIAQVSYDLLSQIGHFIRDKFGIVYYFSNILRQVLMLESQAFSDQITLETGINPASVLFKYVIENAKVRARQVAPIRQVCRFVHYEAEKEALYLSHQPGRLLLITAEQVQELENGTDEIYFVTDPANEAFEFDASLGRDARLLTRRILVESINFDDGDNSVLNRQEQACVYWHTILSFFFLSSGRTKPPIVFIGEPGSGKTTALRMLGTALFGERFEVMSPSSDERDISVAVSRSPLVVMDNVDQPSRFLQDLIARVSTGIVFRRRKLYTDVEEIEVVPRAHLALTSMQPYFNREDIADRLLIFRLKRHEGETFRDEGSIISEILAKRPTIMTGLVLALQRALQNLKQQKIYFQTTTFRMADAGLLLIRIADEPVQMKGLIERMREEQMNFSSEGHPLTELICEWLTQYPNFQESFLTTAELFYRLYDFAREKRIPFTYKSPRSLGMALTNQMRGLQRRLSVFLDPKKTDNLKRYCFALRIQSLNK